VESERPENPHRRLVSADRSDAVVASQDELEQAETGLAPSEFGSGDPGRQPGTGNAHPVDADVREDDAEYSDEVTFVGGPDDCQLVSTARVLPPDELLVTRQDMSTLPFRVDEGLQLGDSRNRPPSDLDVAAPWHAAT
jgi:hypothetical protein